MKPPPRSSPRALIARRVIEDTLRRLPADIREAARPCSVETCDMAACSEEGLDDDILGLFEGCSRLDGEPQSPQDLPRIRLFLDNLWDFAEGDAQVYRDEVRTTLLHELGHYLGLDEDQVEELGLA